MQAIILALAAIFNRTVFNWMLFFVAGKLLLKTLFIVVLPIILVNFFDKILLTFFNFINSHFSAVDIPPMIVQLSGIAAYLANAMQLPLCASIILSAVATRFIMDMVPGLG